jgi:hypothetical protein
MSEQSSIGREVAKSTGVFIGHVAAAILGIILMIVGSALGVSLVLLPLGIPLGLVGVGLFLWALFGWASQNASQKSP